VNAAVERATADRLGFLLARFRGRARIYQVALLKAIAVAPLLSLKPILGQTCWLNLDSGRSSRETGRFGIEYVKMASLSVKAQKVILCAGILIPQTSDALRHWSSWSICNPQGIPVHRRCLGSAEPADHFSPAIVYKSSKPCPFLLSSRWAGLFVRIHQLAWRLLPWFFRSFTSVVIPAFALPELSVEVPTFVFVPILVEAPESCQVSLHSPTTRSDYPLQTTCSICCRFTSSIKLCHSPNTDFRNSTMGGCPRFALKLSRNCTSISWYVSTVWHPVLFLQENVIMSRRLSPQLQVYGVEGVAVADTSIMQTITSVAHNAYVAIGEGGR